MAPSCCTSTWTNADFPSRLVLPVLLLLLVDQPGAEGVALDSVSFLLPVPPELTGSLATNNVLLDAEQIHKGLIGVPHSYTAHGDNMYAVTDRGQVVNVAPCRPLVVANLRPRGCHSAKDCGHLVSIRLSPDNLLLVLDAYRGLFEVHPHTGVTRLLYDANTPINGRRSVYLNDFALLNDGTFVFSDASPTFDYNNEFWIRFEGRPDGRLLTYNSTSGQAKEILAGISYPTGLEVTDDGRALLASEAGRARILRINLTKDKFLQRSYFSENLPGMPEHIRKSGRGTYWVGLSYPRYRGEVSITDQYSNKPASRNFLAVRRTKDQLQLMYTKRGLAIEADGSGKIVRSFHDPTGLKIAEVLELVEYSAVLYVGTRAQESTIRVVGSPNSLTVDSLVQVLRGRCQVTEDRIQETKASLEQQLKAKKNTAGNEQGFSDMQPPMSQNTGPGRDYNPPPPRHVNISQGLSQLHRTLIGAPSRQGYDSYQPPGPPYKQEGYNYAPPYHQQGPNNAPPYQQGPNMAPVYQQQGPNVPPTHKRPRRPSQPNRNPPLQQKTAAFDDPFIPVNGPQADLQLQRANRLPFDQPPPQSGGSPNQPRIVHSLHKGELVSHVILGKKAEAALAGNFLTSLQLDLTQVGASQNENPAPPPPDRAQNVSPTPQPQAKTVAPQKAPEDISALGGFLGFIDSNARAGTPIGSENQQPKQSPNIPMSMPDQKAPGHLEPLHSIMAVPAHTDQQPQSEVSFPGLELFTGSLDQAKQNHISANRPQLTESSRSSSQPSSSLIGDVKKQHGPNVASMPNVIQNMQMFHPTDRPDQPAQSQNNAGGKSGSIFQQKASLLKQGLQQLHKIFQEIPPIGQPPTQRNPGQPPTQRNPGQPPTQRNPGQPPTQRNPGQQEPSPRAEVAVSFDPGDARIQSVSRTNNGDRQAATQVSNKQTRIANSDATAQQDTPINHRHNSVINENNAHLVKQPLTPFSRAATIHHNQPTNNIFDERLPANTPARIGAMHGGVTTNANSPAQENNGQFSQNINSEIHTNGSKFPMGINSGPQTSHNHPSLQSAQPASTQDTRQNTKQQIQESHQPSLSPSNSAAKEQVQQPPSKGGTVPTGYIQVYQSPGQYLLIPLTQTSLIQALRSLSESQMKGAQIVTTNPVISQQSTAAIEQSTVSSLPTVVAASSVKQENLSQIQTRQMPNWPTRQSMPGKSQTQSQNSHMLLQQDSRIQNPHQQNEQQMNQGQPELLVRNKQTQQQPFQQHIATSQRQHSEHNPGQTPFSSANSGQQQLGRFDYSNNKQIPVSTLLAKYNTTPTPKWFTYNSDQENRQPTQQFSQPTQQFTQTSQQGVPLTQQFLQSTQQFAQSTHQFSPSVQQFTQQTPQFAQSNQHLSQPARQLTQSNDQFTQPTRRFTQPAQQFTEQINRMPQQPTQHFNTHPASTSIQQSTQEYNRYPAQKSPQHMSNYSVSRITKFPSQHRMQQFPQPNTQFNQHKSYQIGWQPNNLNTQDITEQSTNQTMNSTSTQTQIQQTTVWQAPHFMQQPQQDSAQAFNQKHQLLSSQQFTENLPQQIIQQPRQQERHSVQESEQMSSSKNGQDSSQYSTLQAVQSFNQPPVKYPNDNNSRQRLTQLSVQISSQSQTQQSPLQFSQPTGQFTQQSPLQFSQPTGQFTQQSPLQFSQPTGQFTQQSPLQFSQPTGQFTQQSPLQFSQPTGQFTQQSPLQFSQPTGQFTEQPTQDFNQIPVQQTAQQLNSHLRLNVSQQFSNDLTQGYSEQPIHQPSQQLNSNLSQHVAQQPVQQSSQQLNSYLTPRDPEEPVEQNSQRFSNQASSQNLNQLNQYASQQFRGHSTSHNLNQPAQTSFQQFSSHSTPHNLQQPSQTSPQQPTSNSSPHVSPVTQPQQPTSNSSPHVSPVTQPQQPTSNSSPHVSPVTQPQQPTSNSSPHVSPVTQPQQLTSQLISHGLEQQFHTSPNHHIMHYTSQQPNQQPHQHTVTANQRQQTDNTQTKFTERITPVLFTQPSSQPSVQYSTYPSSQHLTRNQFNGQSSQHVTQQLIQQQQSTQQNYEQSTRDISQPPQIQQFHDESARYVTQQSQMNIPFSQNFVPQLTQPPQHQTQPPRLQSLQQLDNTELHQLQPTPQQITNHPMQFTQQSMQQSLQQTMEPTQNINTDTAQHFTYQPTQLFVQPSSQHPVLGTEDRSTQPLQQISQQTNLQSMQESKRTTQTKQSVNTDTAQYLTRTPQQATGQSIQQSTQQSIQQPKQITEETVELPNELFTQQPA